MRELVLSLLEPLDELHHPRPHRAATARRLKSILGKQRRVARGLLGGTSSAAPQNPGKDSLTLDRGKVHPVRWASDLP
jgi:hypothetical protein